MVFEIKNKVALVTGGGSGIGFELAKELLLHGAKGVTIADISIENGERATKELQKEFGQNRVVFALTDTTNSTSFESAFRITIDNFQNIDILLNNAGVYGDDIWEKEVDINLKGTINGIILGLEKYLKNYKQGDEAVIVNTSSASIVTFYPIAPIYSATKAALLTLTKCWGLNFHYERTKVRVLAICPSITNTPMAESAKQHVLLPEYLNVAQDLLNQRQSVKQSAAFVAQETVKLIKGAPNSSVWLIEESKPAYQFVSPDKSSFENNILK